MNTIDLRTKEIVFVREVSSLNVEMFYIKFSDISLLYMSLVRILMTHTELFTYSHVNKKSLIK